VIIITSISQVIRISDKQVEVKKLLRNIVLVGLKPIVHLKILTRFLKPILMELNVELILVTVPFLVAVSREVLWFSTELEEPSTLV